MNVVALALAYLRADRLQAALTVLLLAAGGGAIVAAQISLNAFGGRIERDLQGIDLVVGAKGSPLQLILSAVFHADTPTGNIARADADRVARHAQVESVIPLALGDSVGGARIVGTTPAYPAHYGASLAAGRMFDAPMEAVVGATLAARLNLSVGGAFTAQHGLSETGPAHQHAPYTVVGVLAPTGTVVDGLALTSLESVWQVHEVPGEPSPRDQITALLVTYTSPLGAVQVPRWVNAQAGLQAAAPPVEAARLMRLAGGGAAALQSAAVLLIGGAAFAAFVALTSMLSARAADLAAMRAMGARPWQLFAFVAVQGQILAALGAAGGVLLGHLGAEAAGIALRAQQGLTLGPVSFAPESLLLFPIAALAGALAALGPALAAARRDPARVLARG